MCVFEVSSTTNFCNLMKHSPTTNLKVNTNHSSLLNKRDPEIRLQKDVQNKQTIRGWQSGVTLNPNSASAHT